jgi:hypothetical protein
MQRPWLVHDPCAKNIFLFSIRLPSREINMQNRHQARTLSMLSYDAEPPMLERNTSLNVLRLCRPRKTPAPSQERHLSNAKPEPMYHAFSCHL